MISWDVHDHLELLAARPPEVEFVMLGSHISLRLYEVSVGGMPGTGQDEEGALIASRGYQGIPEVVKTPPGSHHRGRGAGGFRAYSVTRRAL